MNNECFLVADGGRARLYLLQTPGRGDIPEATDGAKLVEVRAMIRPDARLPDHAKFSDNRPGTRRSSGGGPDHAVDDHRDANVAEQERRFASAALQAAVDVAEESDCKRITVVAGPKTLGVLRPGYPSIERAGRRLRELDRDLTQLAPAALHDHLAKAGLAPRRGRPPV